MWPKENGSPWTLETRYDQRYFSLIVDAPKWTPVERHGKTTKKNVPSGDQTRRDWNNSLSLPLIALCELPRRSLIIPIGSMYGIYANIWGILIVNVTIYSIHGSYGLYYMMCLYDTTLSMPKSAGWSFFLRYQHDHVMSWNAPFSDNPYLKTCSTNLQNETHWNSMSRTSL